MRLLATFAGALWRPDALYPVSLFSSPPVGCTGPHHGSGTPAHTNSPISFRKLGYEMRGASVVAAIQVLLAFHPVRSSVPAGSGVALFFSLLPRRQEAQKAEVVSAKEKDPLQPRLRGKLSDSNS
ncbi:hypothetical protein BD769DRAFT_1675302 [Suillus cothurnatus]|nr:hypothetical protein BD769DRAFT_1675302 [Suillus cothurnatus]